MSDRRVEPCLFRMRGTVFQVRQPETQRAWAPFCATVRLYPVFDRNSGQQDGDVYKRLWPDRVSNPAAYIYAVDGSGVYVDHIAAEKGISYDPDLCTDRSRNVLPAVRISNRRVGGVV